MIRMLSGSLGPSTFFFSGRSAPSCFDYVDDVEVAVVGAGRDRASTSPVTSAITSDVTRSTRADRVPLLDLGPPLRLGFLGAVPSLCGAPCEGSPECELAP